MTRHPIAQIAPNGNPKSQETSALLPFSREIDYFSRRVSLGASTLTRFFTDDSLYLINGADDGPWFSYAHYYPDALFAVDQIAASPIIKAPNLSRIKVTTSTMARRASISARVTTRTFMLSRSKARRIMSLAAVR